MKHKDHPLYVAMREADLEQWELSALAGVSKTTFSKVASGNHKVQQRTADKLCQVLKKTEAELGLEIAPNNLNKRK